jgi:hypothetical protein
LGWWKRPAPVEYGRHPTGLSPSRARDLLPDMSAARWIVLMAIAWLPCVAAVDLSKPVPRLPLSDGRILQDANFVQFKALDILVKHRTGTVVLRYEALPDEIRAEAEKRRPGGPRWFPGETAPNGLILEGQVFVQTRGAGPYKFGNVNVYAFDAKHLEAWNTNLMTVELPKPLSKAVTDGDGRFKISVPNDTAYFIYCYASRMVGPDIERNEWRVKGSDFKDPKQAILSNENREAPAKKVKIEETP